MYGGGGGFEKKKRREMVKGVNKGVWMKGGIGWISDKG